MRLVSANPPSFAKARYAQRADGAESGGGRLIKLVPLADDMRIVPRGAAAASRTQGIRALLSLPEFLEVASVTPRAFHLMVR